MPALQAAVLRSYDCLAKGDLHHPLRLGGVANKTDYLLFGTKEMLPTNVTFMDSQTVGAAFPKLDTMRWQILFCQRIHVTLAILLQGRNSKAY